MKQALQCLFGIGIVVAAACLWKFWQADGIVMSLMGGIGIVISASSFKK
jgi:hypothetical protein